MLSFVEEVSKMKICSSIVKYEDLSRDCQIRKYVLELSNVKSCQRTVDEDSSKNRQI